MLATTRPKDPFLKCGQIDVRSRLGFLESLIFLTFTFCRLTKNTNNQKEIHRSKRKVQQHTRHKLPWLLSILWNNLWILQIFWIFCIKVLLLPNYCVLYSREKGHRTSSKRQASKQVKGYINWNLFKNLRPCLFYIFTQEIGHQAMGKQAREVVSNSTTRRPRAWSKTMGIATVRSLSETSKRTFI